MIYSLFIINVHSEVLFSAKILRKTIFKVAQNVILSLLFFWRGGKMVFQLKDLHLPGRYCYMMVSNGVKCCGLVSVSLPSQARELAQEAADWL
jgi:hypothetical protein